MKPKSWFVQFALGGECSINFLVEGEADPAKAAVQARAAILEMAPQYADILPLRPALVQAVVLA